MKFPVMERKYMRGMLTIKVWYEQPSMKCKVEFGLWSIDLPREITELRDGLRGVADFEETKRLYKIITMEVNDMLREYYLNYNCSGNIIGEDGIMAEQFTFPLAPANDARMNVMTHIRNEINITAGAITAGATPTQTCWATPSRGEVWADRYEPQMEYLSDEEYEEKKRNGELRSGCVYCVLN